MTTYRILIGLVLGMIATTGMQARTAVLMAHYGSSDADTRHKTIDLITADVRQAFPGIEVREACISPVVRANLAKAGINSDSPSQALERLHTEGYDTVVVQSSTLLEGAEMADVRKAAMEAAPMFNAVITGRPLCYSPDDCQQVVNAMCSRPAAEGVTVVYCGHGNNLPSTATYCQLDYMLHAAGIDNMHVSTIEGYPTVQTTITELPAPAEAGVIELRPLLLVCGNHTRNDIAVDFAGALEDAGYSTRVVYSGFAEDPEIRRIYVDRVAELLGIDHVTPR